MFEVTDNFPGGNIIVKKIDGNNIYIENDLRDTVGNWFFWAFKVMGAQGRTLNFIFERENRVGFYGAAVSHDYKTWSWQYKETGHQGNKFSYTFASSEKEVYFAHDMLYRPERIYEFAKKNSINIHELCKSRKGRSIPCFTLGNGERHIVLTSRHHACESTGSYVLEGVLLGLLEKPIPDTTIFCVPMVDFDGVTDGDQGKGRYPHDHNRDYIDDKESIYPEVSAIRNYIDTHNVVFSCDFHSPYHIAEACSPENDQVFVLYKIMKGADNARRFSKLIEKNILPGAMRHESKYDVNSSLRPWLKEGIGDFMEYALQHSSGLGTTIETAYYGLEDNVFTQESAVLLGKSVRNAIEDYLEGKE